MVAVGVRITNQVSTLFIAEMIALDGLPFSMVEDTAMHTTYLKFSERWGIEI